MPTTLTAADFLSLRMQYKAEQAENEIPAVIEHNFKDGRMVDHYFVVPDPALLADEAVQDFGGKIENILFLQQSEPGAPWQVLLHEPSMIREITFEMPEEEFRAMLAKNNGSEGDYAVCAVMMTTLACLVTLPLVSLGIALMS